MIKEKMLKIELFGNFAIYNGEKNIFSNLKSTSRLRKLLQYLLTHKHRQVSTEELAQMLYSSDFKAANSTIRTMIYRIRTIFSDEGICAKDIILSKNGGYAWNNEINHIIDAEEFEKLCKEAKDNPCQEGRIKQLLEAAEIYKGEFLADIKGEMWTMPIAHWYSSLYTECTRDAAGLLLNAERFDEAESLCMESLRIDPFDNLILEYHLRAMIAQGRDAEALEEYKRMEIMYNDVLGVSFPDSLRELYESINPDFTEYETSLEFVLSEWSEDNNFPHMHYCDLSTFKNIYKIEARSAKRSGREAYVVMFETACEINEKSGIMKKLGSAIPGSLREGDLFTRSGTKRYMLMLCHLTYEKCKGIIDSILCSLELKYLSKINSISIKPISPAKKCYFNDSAVTCF